MITILLTITFLVIILDILLIICWLTVFKDPKVTREDIPNVSILVAARNEAGNIARCLESLLLLNYPKDKFEILIGDDNSTDTTFEIAESYSNKHNNIRVFRIKETIGFAKGKANVLAHLAKEANGNIFLITDADVQVPSTWISAMLQGLKNKTGIVNGFTCINNNEFQNLDWLLALGMVKVICDLGRPVTAMGNNMLVTREAYESIGGYESIPFSITEDFELFKHIRSKGYDIEQLANSAVLGWSSAIEGFKSLLHQRKRWMIGAVQLPWPIVTLLLMQAVYYPSLLGLIILSPKLAVATFALKWIVQFIFILMVQNKLKLKVNVIIHLVYEFYSAFIALSTGIFYLLPVKVRWKDRKY